jgi:polysaccharide biosynthesis transport protein
VSKHFELLRQVSGDLERWQPQPPVRGTKEHAIPSAVSIAEDKKSDWRRTVHVLRTHWKLSTLFAAVVMLTVTCVTFLQKPTYEPTARIEVDPPGELFSLAGGGGPGPSDTEYLETQAKNLKSENLAVAVIRKLGLDHNPELVDKAQPSKRENAEITTSASGLELTPDEGVALENFQSHLKVKRDTSSRLILISFASHNPQLAALITNTVLQQFIEGTFQTQHDAIMQSTEWLSRQLDDIRTKMEDSTRALAQFEGSIGITDLDENKNTYSEQMGDLSRQLTQAESDRIQLEALLKNVQEGNSDALPEVRNSAVIQALSQKLAEQHAELSQALVVYGKNHPTVRKLQGNVDELQSQLDAQKRAIVSSLRASYAAAQARERLMTAEMMGTTKHLDQMARYIALKKEVQSNVQLYNSLYAKVKEAGIAAASRSGNVRVVDQARVLNYPTAPNRLLNLTVGFLVAVFGGVMLAFVREEFDTRLRTPEDITKWIGMSNIAIIPAIVEAHGSHRPFRTRLLKGNADEEGQTSAFVLDRPHSPETEALHSLQASIMLSQRGSAPQILQVVSSFPGEGKTTVALNLALALAQQGETCLVDADLRKAKVTSRFGLRSASGLADFLGGDAALENIWHGSGMNNLTIVPAGGTRTNPGQLFCSSNSQPFFQQLRQRFKFVVVDSVPILPFADGRALSPLVDALVFVGRAGVTTREAMRRSMQLLEEMQAAPILEFVLNAADVASTEYYQYGYAAYGSKSSES